MSYDISSLQKGEPVFNDPEITDATAEPTSDWRRGQRRQSECKRKAVAEVLKRERTQAIIAKEFGISTYSLRLWVMDPRYNPNASKDSGAMPGSIEAKIADLRAQIDVLQKALDIMKGEQTE